MKMTFLGTVRTGWLLAIVALLPASTAFAQLSSTPQEKFWTTDGTVYSMLETNGVVYIGGDFSYVGPNNGSGAVAATNNTNPSLGWPGVDGDVYAAVSDGTGGWVEQQKQQQQHGGHD